MTMAPSRALTSTLRSTCSSCLRQKTARRPFSQSNRLQNDTQSSNLPRIARPSLWASLVPKAFKARSDPAFANGGTDPSAPKAKKEWNPATIFIVLGLLVGSNAIQIISLRREMLNFSRQTDARLELLREVVQKVKNGEAVDVKRVLGTGDDKHEAEWEEVVRELESTDMLWEGKLKRDRRKAEMEEQKAVKRQEDASRKEDLMGQDNDSGADEESGQSHGNNVRKPRFLM